MNIQHLKYVIEVERTGSITQAADNLFMNQPNLSKVIRELEDEMGFTIFKRSSRGIELTARGATFLDYAKQIVSLMTELESLNKPHDAAAQRFAIATPIDGCIAEAFIRFCASLDHSKEMELNFIEAGLMDTIDCVLSGRTSLGIIRYKEINEPQILRHIEEKDLKFSLINDFARCLLFSSDSPLAAKEQLSVDDLEDYVEVAQTDVTIPHIKKAGSGSKGVKKRIWVYDRASQLSLLARDKNSYMWTHPLPAYLLRRYDLVQSPCSSSGNRYKDMVICEKRHRVTDLEQSFLDQLAHVLEKARKEFAQG